MGSMCLITLFFEQWALNHLYFAPFCWKCHLNVKQDESQICILSIDTFEDKYFEFSIKINFKRSHNKFSFPR